MDAQEAYTYDKSVFGLKAIENTTTLKLHKINLLMTDILNGVSVSTTRLRSVFSMSEYCSYTDMLKEIRHFSEILYEEMPEPLKKYNLLLNKADLMNGRYEKMAGTHTGNSTTRSKALNKAESMYEEALECLEEIYGMAERGDYGPEMRAKLDAWMDRPIEFGVTSNLGIDVVAIPRVRGSKSHHALDSGKPKLSKRMKREECALMALLVSACNIAYVLPETEQEPKALSKNLTSLRARTEAMMKQINPERD